MENKNKIKSSLDFQFKMDEQLNGGYDGFKG